MDYSITEIQYRMQPHSKIEGNTVKLLPLSKRDAQDVLTDIVMQEVMDCNTLEKAREIDRNLRLISKYTDMKTTRYMCAVRATIKRFEKK